MNYRHATIEDIEQLIQCRIQQLQTNHTEYDTSLHEKLQNYFHHMLTTNQLRQWIVEEKGRIIATAGMIYCAFPPSPNNPVGTRCYITNVYTDPSFRKQGICTTLLHILVNEARCQNIRSFFLHATIAGKPLYHKFGFRCSERWMEFD